jgi:phosphoadenosine phosphosulfate reductase
MAESNSSPSATDILKQAATEYAGRIVFATSFGAEDQVLTHLIAKNGINIPLATLDTGRLFPETYDLWAKTEEVYGLKITPFFPDAKEVEELVASRGINLFRKSIDDRHACCQVRKLAPLHRLLQGREAWVCGLRSAQSVTRVDLKPIERDEANGLIKVSPLADWTEEEVWRFIKAYEVPYNELHDHAYPSIGCACCTRAIKRTEETRDGRWWWEAKEQRECGLHKRPRH